MMKTLRTQFFKLTFRKTRLSVCLFAALFSGNVTANDTVHLQLRWLHQFQFAGYYAALEKGYYEDAGLNVVIHEGFAKSTSIQEVLQNHAEYGVDNSEILHERLHGEPLVALAAIFQHSPSVLVVRENIKSPRDLIGKKLMLMASDGDDDILGMMSNAGVSKKQIEIVPISLNIQDFIDEKVDGYAAYSTDEIYSLMKKNIKFNVLEPRIYGVDFYSDILFTTENEISKHPTRARAFRQASIDGWNYAMQHPEEIIDLLITKYHSKKSKDELLFEAHTMRPLLMSDLVEMGNMNSTRWKRMADVFVENKLVSRRDANKRLLGFMPSFDVTMDKTMLQRYVTTGVLIFILVLFVLVILLIAFNGMRRENRKRREMEKSHQLLCRQVNHMQKLESIGRLTSGIAHDFNNILACMLGFNEMNKLMGEDITDKSLREIIENNTHQIDIAGRRAAELIEKMLIYCRQDTKKQEIISKPTLDVINEVLGMLRPALTNRVEIELVCECLPEAEHDCCENIHIDAIDLYQIVTNLVVNARDAMEERGGKITITLKPALDVNTQCIACAALIKGDLIELSVMDNGSGIEPQMITRIFDPFFSTKEVGKGTGLGLSTVSGMVHTSGGHILVNSELGQFTEIKLLFPIVNSL
jgi:signal transduction histidine kinase